jgi:hypothetical protein
MANHIWSEERLASANTDQHIKMLVEDWNEPDGYTAMDSTICVHHACIVVATPVKMTFLGDGPGGRYPDTHTDTVVVGTYIGEDLVSTVCVDPKDATIAYIAAEGVHAV